MRNYVFSAMLIGVVPFILYLPYLGIIMWSVVSYLNPHRFMYPPFVNQPWAILIALATMAAFVISKERKHLPMTPVSVLMLVLLVWVSISTVFAMQFSVSFDRWTDIVKVMVMAFLTIPLMMTRERIHALVWVLVICVGVYGVKGGLFFGLTGGGGRVYGPPNSMLKDNNQLAVGLLMILPLMRYLYLHSAEKLTRFALLGAMAFTALSVIGSFSRGAFVTAFASGVFFMLKSRHRFAVAFGLAMTAVVGLSLAPDEWFSRMDTISNYSEDASVRGRFEAWTYAWKVAEMSPLWGGGFNINDFRSLYFQLVPEADQARAFHSNYFQVLGEHGFVGLFLFLLLMGVAFLEAGRIIRQTRNTHDTLWAADLARMIQVSIVGYAVGGLFLNLAWLDLYYSILGLLVLLNGVVLRGLSARVPGSPAGAAGRNRRPPPTPAPAPPPATARSGRP